MQHILVYYSPSSISFCGGLRLTVTEGNGKAHQHRPWWPFAVLHTYAPLNEAENNFLKTEIHSDELLNKNKHPKLPSWFQGLMCHIHFLLVSQSWIFNWTNYLIKGIATSFLSQGLRLVQEDIGCSSQGPWGWDRLWVKLTCEAQYRSNA